MTIPCLCNKPYETHLMQRYHACHDRSCRHIWDLSPHAIKPTAKVISDQIVASLNEVRS